MITTQQRRLYTLCISQDFCEELEYWGLDDLHMVGILLIVAMITIIIIIIIIIIIMTTNIIMMMTFHPQEPCCQHTYYRARWLLPTPKIDVRLS